MGKKNLKLAKLMKDLVPSRTTFDVAQSHLLNLMIGNFEDDINANYSSDAVLMTAFGIKRGRESILNALNRINVLSQAQTKNFDVVECIEGHAFMEVTVESPDGQTHTICDSIVVNDGKIVVENLHVVSHVVAAVTTPPLTVAVSEN